jgi:HK97 family phage portal protein
MAIKDTLRKLLGYRLGGGQFTEMAIPPGMNYQGYLEAYGNIGWLFGAVSLIASSVASSEWVLYRMTGKGEREEIDNHPLIDLWNHVNPFQTRYQFLLMLETYVELVGESFIALNFNRLKLPAEMWLAPPGNMSIAPSATNYIDHYEYTKGGVNLRLEVPEVIHIMNPNPANPYRGIGAAKSISADLDSEFYAGKYQNKLFYNDATPRLFLEFPDLPPAEERKRLRDEFLDIHQGWRNAYKPGFLWGGAKANTVSLTAKDMDFAELRNASKKLILGAYHIPESLIGAAEIGSRARAEADEYIFAKYTIKPALQRIREALNEQLCPLYDESLVWDFIDPVPDDVERERTQNRADFQAGIITREEARVAAGLDEKAEGTFLLPFSVVEVPAKMLKLTARKAWADTQKDSYWKTYIAKTEGEEKMFITSLNKLWDKQEKEVVSNLKDAKKPEDALFNRGTAEKEFNDAMKPIIGEVFSHHYGDAQGLIAPENPHKDWTGLNELALAWIKAHSLELAKLLNETSIEDLRKVLAEGFAEGESIDDLTNRVLEYYGKANKIRARLVARTETVAASNEGALQGYGDVGVEEVQWYTAQDEKAEECEVCWPENNVTYKVSESHGLIPAHPNCRCCWIPVV